MRLLDFAGFVCLMFVLAAAYAADEQSSKEPKKDTLDNYLEDVAPGAVSAGNLVGLAETAITEIQTSQDLILAVKPLASRSTKSGFGVAITPMRTTLTPMSGQTYKKNEWMRPIANITLSYAENGATVSGGTYRKYGVSADTYYYFDDDHDPVLLGNTAFVNCEERKKLSDEARQAAERNDRAAFDAIKPKLEDAVKKCVDAATAKRPWNADRISVSLGAAWIRPDGVQGPTASLGRSVTLAGIKKAGDSGAIYISLRSSTREVDLTTLTTAPEYKKSNIVAARYTHGSKDDNGDVKVLAEVSNAKKSEVTASNAVFKYAVGVDKKLAKGAWVEFRLGKNRTFDGTDTQTTSLLTFTWQPSTGLFN